MKQIITGIVENKKILTVLKDFPCLHVDVLTRHTILTKDFLNHILVSQFIGEVFVKIMRVSLNDGRSQIVKSQEPELQNLY